LVRARKGAPSYNAVIEKKSLASTDEGWSILGENTRMGLWKGPWRYQVAYPGCVTPLRAIRRQQTTAGVLLAQRWYIRGDEERSDQGLEGTMASLDLDLNSGFQSRIIVARCSPRSSVFICPRLFTTPQGASIRG
jgi:hypothetical protein